jgi:hypothetical protein
VNQVQPFDFQRLVNPTNAGMGATLVVGVFWKPGRCLIGVPLLPVARRGQQITKDHSLLQNRWTQDCDSPAGAIATATSSHERALRMRFALKSTSIGLSRIRSDVF